MTNPPLLDEDISIPLCVDLDGTLIKGDTTETASLKYAKCNPLRWFLILCWFLSKGMGESGRAHLKQKLAEHIDLTSDDWEFVPGILKLLEQEHKAKRPIYLVSATDQKFAHAVANDPQCKKYFKKGHVIATQGKINLRSKNKADHLVKLFGEKKFIYAGNSKHDLQVWKKCVSPVIAIKNKDCNLLKKLQSFQTKIIEIEVQ